MSAPITPDPSIHNLPAAEAAQQHALNVQQLEALGHQLIQTVINAVLTLITGGLLGGSGGNPAVNQLFALLDQIPIIGQFAELLQNLLGLLGIQTGQNNASSNTPVALPVANMATNPATFNPSSATLAAQVPGLNIFGQLRPAVAAMVPGAHVGTVNPQLLANPGFDTSASVSPTNPSQVSWDGTTGNTNPGSLLIKPDGAYSYSNISSPIPVVQGDTLQMSVWTKWSGLTYSGTTQPVRLEVLQFNQGSRVASTVVAQTAASPPANQTSWTQLTSSPAFVVPAGVDTVYARPIVDQGATAGSVWFDDASATKINTIHPALVNNVPANQILGIQGISDIGATVQGMWDNIANTIANQLGLSGVQASGNSLSALTQVHQGHAQITNTAANQAAAATNTLNIQNNRSISAGLEATVEANIDIHALGTGSTPSTVTVTQSASGGGFVRVSQAKTMGFFQWWGSSSGTVTSVFYNFYKMDGSGNVNLLFSSSDQHVNVSGTNQWIKYNFAGANQFAANPGDVIGVELQMVGSGSLTAAGLGQTWQTNHPSANTKRSAFSQNWGTGGASNISAASVGYTGSNPYVGIGVSNLPANYQPPVTTQYTTNGSYTYTIPSWANFLDIVPLGAGGAGGAANNFLTGQGGGPGVWAPQTLHRGVDFLSSETTAAVVVGAGAPVNSYNGANGGASTVTYTNVSSVQVTITAAGGPGGWQGNNHNPANPNTHSAGAGAPNETFNGITYTGGTNVNAGSTGSSPGGGGGGGLPYSNGAAGADGFVSITARQS